jgi:signal transduction histidine kinase
VLDLPEEPVQVHLDSERTQRVLVNLLENALQFTSSEGTVTVVLEVLDEAVQVAVHDTGVGIAEEELDRVFDEFYQVGETLTRTQEGLGLGLTIARKLVRLHDGEIWVDSAGEGEGTSAFVRLPYEDD